MPVVSAPNLVRLRTTRHATRLSLSVYHPAAIWTARVDGTQTAGDTTITVKTVVQVKAPFKNCLVMVGSTPGNDDFGTSRFVSYSAPTLTVTSNNGLLPDTAYVTIVEEIKPSAIHPTLNSSDVVFEDNNIAYTDENLKYQPLAKMGAPAVAYIDPATGLATVKFYSRSEAFGGATLSTYAWVFPSGTPGTSATAGTAGVPVSVTWNTAGQYYVSLTVTDSNGKTHTGYRPVFIYDSSTVPYSRIEVGGMEGDVESGVWSTHLTVHGDADGNEFPHNALCVLSAIDYYGAEQVSIGNETWRENIVMVGYIRKGTVKIDRLYGFVEFDVDSVSGVMDNLWQIAGALTTTAGTPAGWHTLKNMTYNLAAHHVLTQHSTVTQVCDCYPNLPTYTVANLDLIDASLSENLRQIVAATRGRVGCNAQGSLYLEINPQLQSFAARSASYTLTTTNPDVRDEIDLGDELQEKQVSQVDFAGENATAAPVFSLAPASPWPTGHSEKVDGIRVASQAEANEFAGLYEGYENNAFADVVINWRGNYRVFDTFPAEPLAVTFTAAQNTREAFWTAQRCWVKRVSYEYRPGILLASAVVEKDSYGALGVTGNYPAAEPDPVAPAPPAEPPIIDPPAPPSTIPQGKGNLLYVSSLKGMAKCVGAYGTNGTDGTPVWTAINTGLAGDALKVRWFNLDPWSRSGDHFTAAWAMTDDGLYRCTGLPDAATWTQQLSRAAAKTLIGSATDPLLAWRFAPTVLTAGYVAVCIIPNEQYDARDVVYYAWSTDYGNTWNATTRAIASASGAAIPSFLRMECSFHVSGRYFLDGSWAIRGGYTDADAWDKNLYEVGRHVDALYLKDAATGRMFGFATHETHSGAGANAYWPYCNNAGVVYPTDDVGYTYGADHTGTSALRRYTTWESPLWRTVPTLDFRAYTSIGDAAMGNLDWFFTNMFNEDYGVAIDASNIWLTANQGGAWTRKNAPSAGGRTFSPRYEFIIPVDGNIVFFTGKEATGTDGVAQVVMTPDFATTLTDITNHGGANDLDTVLGLAAGDMNGSLILVDYYKV